jgi:hypothetical protein
MNANFENVVDWGILETTWDIIWNDPIGWFLELPLFNQILIIIGLIALVIVALVLVYYVVKGVVYLLYYLFKGLYYLFKSIYTRLSKLFEGLSYAISGEPRKKDQTIPPISNELISPPEQVSNFEEKTEVKTPYYCTECGQTITVSMNSLLTSRGVAFCFFCGKEFKLKKAETSKI